MNHLELRQRFEGKHDSYREFSVALVDLDRVPGDDVDVVISALREVEWEHDSAQLRLFSVSSRPDVEDLQPLAIFENFIAAWPLPGVLAGEYTVMVQVPIAPEEFPGETTQFVPLAGVHVGVDSQEVWLLVRDPSEYPEDILPR